MKYKAKKFLTTIKNIISFPTFWISIAIFIFAIISLFISIVYEKSGDGYIASIYSNIFTGLLTGLIISLLSGIKSVYIAYMEGRLNWLEEIHRMILEELNEERNLWSAKNESEEIFFDIAYDVASKTNWVNDKILHSNFDKIRWFDPIKYFKKHYNYDCVEIEKVMSEMHDYLKYEYCEKDNRNILIEKIRKISRILINLNSNVLSDIDNIKIKLSTAKKYFL